MRRQSQFGAFFKERRIALGMTLRRFCLENGLDAGNVSRLERGLFGPPEDRKLLEKYAHYLRLKKGSAEWIKFFDLAAATAGQIPEEIMADEEVVERLPVLFRTLRGEKVPTEKLDELVRLIRGR